MAMQQEFLPTDTTIHTSQAWGFIGLSLIFVTILFIVLSVIKNKAPWKQIYSVLTAVSCFGIFFFFVTQANVDMQAGFEAKTTNKANLNANIEAVYDIEGIDLPNSIYTSDDSALDVTVYQDGLAYPAKLSQDPKTYEPTLSVVVSSDVEAKPIRKK
ncbi:MAG: hypothetical protein H9W81_15780 [Enterococcus sp.]|nr:hypothetical protein [Enterococcus sp.]